MPHDRFAAQRPASGPLIREFRRSRRRSTASLALAYVIWAIAIPICLWGAFFLAIVR